MYQATIGQQRAQTSGGQNRVGVSSQTPQVRSSKAYGLQASKSQGKMNMTAMREQGRKFGEYHGEDGIEQTAAAT